MFFKKQKINDSEVMKFGFLGGIAQAAYCLGAVLFINMVGTEMSKQPNQIASMILVLLFFVFSAAISAIFVFGYPAYQASQKKYMEAVATVSTTLATLLIVGILLYLWATLI